MDHILQNNYNCCSSIKAFTYVESIKAGEEEEKEKEEEQKIEEEEVKKKRRRRHEKKRRIGGKSE